MIAINLTRVEPKTDVYTLDEIFVVRKDRMGISSEHDLYRLVVGL